MPRPIPRTRRGCQPLPTPNVAEITPTSPTGANPFDAASPWTPTRPVSPYARALGGQPPRFCAADAYPTGPRRLLVVGPPGTGKTWTCLECFVLRVLDPRTVQFVLACTFTRAGAQELRKRISKELGNEADHYRAVATTIHAEALRRVVLDKGRVTLVGGRVVTSDSLDDLLLPEDALGGTNQILEQIGDDRRRAAIRMWDLARNRMEPHDLARAYADIQPTQFDLKELKAEIDAYEREKHERKEIDFVDLLQLALAVDPPCRELVLVDEVQDCSLLQWKLIELWGSEAKWFVLVGDPDQSVHRWCGACPERMSELSDSFEVRQLHQSRRVPRSHHALALPLIRLNANRIDVGYLPTPLAGTVREVEEEQVIGALGAAAREGESALLLARSRAILRRYVKALAAAGIPFRNERGYSPLGCPDRRMVVQAVLDLGEDRPAAVEAVIELLARLPARDYFPNKKKLWVLERVEELQGEVHRAHLETLGVRVGRLLEGDLADRLLRPKLAQSAPMRERIAQDMVRLLSLHGPQVLDTSPTVVLTTAHGAKGREADLVVVDLEAPHLVLDSLWRPGRVENERQLLYVALTRSKDRLLLVRHDLRDLGDELGLGRVA